MNESAGLTSTGGKPIALKSVHIEGRVQGLLASVIIGQQYRNDSGEKLEILYTFPLAWGATLLGLDVIIGGKRLQAGVVAKKEAWDQYEDALYEGDTPFLVEQSETGLYTANLGGLEPGEAVTLYFRYAQLLRIDHGTTRLTIPCAVAPRHDEPPCTGFRVPTSITTDSMAEYPLSVYFKVLGELAGATIQCPTHDSEMKAIEGGVAIALNSAFLDRDVVLQFGNVQARSFTLLAADGDAYLALASFCPQVSTQPKPLALNILVDCSCSMAGDSITQAKQALYALSALLKGDEFVSFSRFGDYYLKDKKTVALVSSTY